MKHQLSIFKEQENPIVRMHNHLVTANFGYLELNAMRIFLIMLAKLEWDAKDLSPIRINLHDIVPNYSGGKNFELITKAIDELKSKMKDVRMLSEVKGKKIYDRMTVIDNIRYAEGTDFLEANFGVAIRPYLIQLKGNFTTAELKELLKLKSSYAIRFYMLVKSLYRENQVYSTSIVDLKNMLIGNTDTYSEYKEFKKFVLKPSQKALDKTSAAFIFEEERKGRSVHTLHIKAKTSVSKIESTIAISQELKTTLENYKVNTVKIIEMLNEGTISEEYINFIVDLKKKDTKIKKLGGAIYDAITNKHHWDDYESSLTKIIVKPVIQVKTSQDSFTWITMEEAQLRYKVAKDKNETKFPFPGFVKGLKTGFNIMVEGFSY